MAVDALASHVTRGVFPNISHFVMSDILNSFCEIALS